MTNNLGDYGDNPNAGVNVNDDHGWGGYCWTGGVPDNLLGTARYQDITVTVRKELVELHQLAFQIADQVHHYKIWTHNPNGNGEVWGPWSYENRCISGSSTPSNHSKGKATDWNAPYNPYYTGMGNWTSDFPPAMVAHLEAIGLCWGGRYGDTMHLEYGYSPDDVAGHVAKAKAILGKSPLPPPLPPEDDSMSAADVAAIKSYIGGLISPITTALAGLKAQTDADLLAGRADLTLDKETRMFKACRANNSAAVFVYGPGVFVWVNPTAWSVLQRLGAVSGAVGAVNLLELDRLQGAVHPRWQANGEPQASGIARKYLTTPPTAKTYKVVAGDGLGGIAKKFNTTIAILMALNKLPDPNDIAIGKVLILPSA